jgi:leucyl aminopeptidase
MAVPTLHLTTDPPLETRADVLVLGVRKTDDGPTLLSDDPAFAPIAGALDDVGATGAIDEVVRLAPVAGSAAGIVLVGLGAGELTADAARGAVGAAVRRLTGVASVAVALPLHGADALLAALEGAGIASYAYLAYKSVAPTRRPPASVTVHAPGTLGPDESAALVRRATATAEAVHTVRDLVNAPPSDLYPASFADRVLELAEGLPVRVEVLDELALAEGGFGGLLGVGQGSSRPPRLVTVRYEPAEASGHLALVGKGITFDSGGLSLKPPGSMVGMKYDMTGAATALAVTLAAARLGLPTQVTAWLCLAENLPSGTATRPNDVLHMRGGATVEVLNTDAEGRLVLADGLVAASEEHPDAIIDIATLTGAARVAMGERTVPVMGDAALAARLVELAGQVGETFWSMPLPVELRASLDSDIADIANAKPGSTAGGMMLAGHFLQHFVGKVSAEPGAGPIAWAHLDIAGSANNAGAPHGEIGKGPTGVTVRTLLALTEVFSRP